MSGLYIGLRRSAESIIGRLGVPVVIKRNVPATYDPASGEMTGGPVSVACSVAFSLVEKRFVDGESVMADDLQATVAASAVGDFVPQPGDELVRLGITYAVVKVMTTQPGPLAVMHKMVVRA